jgi:hypothetical protein
MRGPEASAQAILASYRRIKKELPDGHAATAQYEDRQTM